MSTGEDRRGRLATERLERDRRVAAAEQSSAASLDEGPDERPVLVERRPSPRAVLLEDERGSRRPARPRARRTRRRRGRSRAGPNGGAVRAPRPLTRRAGVLSSLARRGTSTRCGSRRPGRASLIGRSAARTRAAGLAVDGALSEARVERAAHELRGLGEHRAQLVVRDVAEPRPGRDLRAPERFGAPHVPDARHESLVEQRPRRSRGSDPRPRIRLTISSRSGGSARMSGPSLRTRRVVELEHRPVPENRLRARPAQDEPRHAAPRARPVSLDDLPAALHAQVAAEDETVLEAQEQVLADRLDADEPAPVEPAPRRRSPAPADAASRPRAARRPGSGAAAATR